MRTQYQVQNETQIRKNQKVIKNDNDELVVKKYPKNKQPIIQERKINLPSCPSFKQKNGQNSIKGTIAKIVNTLSTNKNIRLIKKFVDKIIIFLLD